MKPYYDQDGIIIYHGDFREILPHLPKIDLVLTDPPYNVGYHYESYSDNLSKEDYSNMLRFALSSPSVVIHYPEDMFFVAKSIGQVPEKCVSWVYNAHTPRKWRTIAWFGIRPDLSKVKQPYKNEGDKRIQKKIANGEQGASLYDWWHIEQVKNVCHEKTEHPCQIPVEIMNRIILTTEVEIILDPFMGSGTTLVAAHQLHRKAIGIEIEEKYCEIAVKRLRQGVLSL
jgi:DNA modification methylase